MNAKEKQAIIAIDYLKPMFKEAGYFTRSQTWWKDNGAFFIIINLQNFSYNTKNDVYFCFNIGVAVKHLMKDPNTKTPNHYDMNVTLRDGAYLKEEKIQNVYRNNNGYFVNKDTDIESFSKAIKVDFEENILPVLDGLKTLDDCMNYHDRFSFWGQHLRKIINEKP